MGWDGVDWIRLVHHRDQWRARKYIDRLFVGFLQRLCSFKLVERHNRLIFVLHGACSEQPWTYYELNNGLLVSVCV